MEHAYSRIITKQKDTADVRSGKILEQNGEIATELVNEYENENELRLQVGAGYVNKKVNFRNLGINN